MSVINSDIRLINGNVVSAAETIKEYLPDVGYEVEHEDIAKNYADIKARNIQRSVLKLYFSNTPQIVHWHLKKKSGEQIQIEVKSDLFPQFRFFYYTVLGILLTGFSLFFTPTSIFKFKSISFLQQFDQLPFSSFNILIAVSFLVLVLIFYLRSINTDGYEVFLNRFYELLNQNNSVNEVVLHSNFGFPDIFKVPPLLVLFLLITLLFSKINISDVSSHLPHYFFLNGAIILVTTLVILVFIMISRPAIATRVMFVIIGFGLCVPIAIYGIAPIELSYPGDIQQKFESYFEIEKIIQDDFVASNYLQEDNYIKSRKFVQKVSIFYAGGCVLLFLIAGILFLNITNIPIRVVKVLNRFLLTQPDSDYYQALHPENSSYLFSFVIIFLWALLGAVNILGLYFSFSILEKAVFNINMLFSSELARLFYDNTQITFIVLVQPKYGGNITILFHRLFMLIYSFPIIIIFILVLSKNIKSMIKMYYLMKIQSYKHGRLEKYLADKIEDICKFADIRVPIIRVVDSPNISATTQHLGFPVFKNILVVSKGTLNELQDNELNALLAHEIWHIKKHTLIRRFLCFLSDYSLFGNGFLAVLQNSFQIEKEADGFAKNWLEHNKMPRHSLKSLLEKQEELNALLSILQPTSSLNFAMLKDGPYRKNLLERYDKATKTEKIRINLTFLYQIYFGEEVLSYFHPPISQRIAWIEVEGIQNI